MTNQPPTDKTGRALKYAEYTRNTNEWPKSIAHQSRFRQASQIINAKPEDTILDYGCGDAHLFTLLNHMPPTQLVAFDPDPKMISEIDTELASKIRIYGDVKSLLRKNKGAFSLIVCMEVCEHLSNDALHDLLNNIKTLAAIDSRIVFGVPIETGFSGFAKGIYRVLKGGRMSATLATSIRVLFSLSTQRSFTDAGWTGSHIGFNDRAFLETLKENNFYVEQKDFLPFSWARRIINNEVYYTCRISS